MGCRLDSPAAVPCGREVSDKLGSHSFPPGSLHRPGSVREPLNDGKLLPYQLPAVFYPSGTGNPNYAVPTLTIDQAAPAREAAPELLVDERDAGSDITGYAAIAAAATSFEVRRERQTTNLMVQNTGSAKGRRDTGFGNERTRRRGRA